MNPLCKLLVSTMVVLAFGACANAKTVRAKVDYNALAGAPVESMYYTRLVGWQSVDTERPWADQLIVQTTSKRAYLLSLFGPCQDLDFSVVIGLTHFAHRVSAGFDHVIVSKHSRCRIKTIQPIDVKAMRAAQKLAVTLPSKH